VTIPSRSTPEFWRLYRVLPADVKELARKNYLLWAENALHPSLHFKPLGKPNWSVRIGNRYRAVGKFAGNTFLWEWIGSHADYSKHF
jgi:hypothetical protein